MNKKKLNLVRPPPEEETAIAAQLWVDSGKGQDRTLSPLSAFWPPVFASEQETLNGAAAAACTRAGYGAGLSLKQIIEATTQPRLTTLPCPSPGNLSGRKSKKPPMSTPT